MSKQIIKSTEIFDLALKAEVAHTQYRLKTTQEFYNLKERAKAYFIDGSFFVDAKGDFEHYKPLLHGKLQNIDLASFKSAMDNYSYESPYFFATSLGFDRKINSHLTDLKYVPIKSKTLLYCDIESVGTIDSSENIICSNKQEALDDAKAVYKALNDITDDGFNLSYTHWLLNSSVSRLYLAYDDKKPIAMGTMSIHDDLALFYSGIVNPDYRGRSLQKALINKRLQDAKSAGVKFVFATGVPPFSASEANLKACGFELLCHRNVWEEK